MRKIKTWAAAAAMLALSGAAQSALINRGGGMIYDTTANITWLADMNYAVTSGYAASGVAPGSMGEIYTDGRMGWAAAKSWADNLVYGGFSDWRLPNAKELGSLVEIACTYPAINDVRFPGSLGAVWTSSNLVVDLSQAGVVDFVLGNVNYFDKSVSFSVRLVRGGA